MSLLDNVAPAPRKVMTLFYVVDTSGSMCGSKIGSVNSAMEEAITSDLPEISAANDDAEIKVAIMQFSSGCSWITPQSGPIAIGDVIWNDLNAGGVTDLGAACKELDKKLSRNEYLNSQTGAYAPVILLFSALLWRGITLAAHAPDRFGALLVVGFVVQVALQAVLNIAVVTNTIPNTGISLPFFSSGGTSLMMLLGEMGIVLSVSRGET